MGFKGITGPIDRTLSTPISFEREKHYSFGIRIGYRFYYLIRKFTKREKLLARLLNFTWLLQRISQEQTYYFTSNVQQNHEILRPRNIEDILNSAKKNQKILDFGGGIGTITQALLENGNQVAYLDHSMSACKSALQKFAIYSNFSLILPENLFTDTSNSYDLVVLSHVLEHVVNRQELLTNLKAITRKIHIEVPDYSSDPLNYARSLFQLPVHKDDDHVVEFTMESLTALILESGLYIETITVRDGCIVALCKSM